MHLLAVGHFERDKGGNSGPQSSITHIETEDMMDQASESCDPHLEEYQTVQSGVDNVEDTSTTGNNLANGIGFFDTGSKAISKIECQISDSGNKSEEEESIQAVERDCSVNASSTGLSIPQTTEPEEKQMAGSEMNHHNKNLTYNGTPSNIEPTPLSLNGPSLETHQSESSVSNVPDSLVPVSPNHDLDSPRRSPVPCPAPKVQKEPINGLSPHVMSSLNEQSTNGIAPSDELFTNGSELSKDFTNLKQKLSPVIQSNSKTIFENPPPILEGPIQSNSSVHSRQQLTC